MTAAPAAARDSLTVTANAPTVSVAPRNPGRNFLELPALEYTFRILAHCAGNRSAESLSLNVADSRIAVAADGIASDGPTEMSLLIPAGQIAPIVVDNFCLAADEEDANPAQDAQAQMTILAAYSAQASLLCAGEEDKAMTYVSQTLDVSLTCQVPAEADAPAASN